jgi:hypothetical protein
MPAYVIPRIVIVVEVEAAADGGELNLVQPEAGEN